MAAQSGNKWSKAVVIYRGQKYKVKGTKTMKINGNDVVLLSLAHPKYNMLVNSKYVIKC